MEKSRIIVPPGSDRPRYELLDGLRGVAALVVIMFHFGEAFATSWLDQMVNHGYLAVDFFFVLSGFVIGYAYDPRFRNGSMTPGRFMLRRIIRLHPMVILGLLFGAVCYLIQGCVRWDGTQIPLSAVGLAMLLGLLMIPALPHTILDVRGNAEMFPLNGPQWSLFFEYVGSLLYAVVLHHLSTRLLRFVTVISGVGLAVCTFANFSGGYTTGFGWSILGWDIIPCGGLLGGFLHMSYSFGMGLLLTRDFRAWRLRGAFWICSALIVIVCFVPYLTPTPGEVSQLNGLYDVAVTLVVFPAIVWLGASGSTTDRLSSGICEWLGQISYPVYIIHYPMMYLFYSWVWSDGITLTEALPVMGCMFIVIPLTAWAALRFYDEPVRRWLSARLLRPTERSRA